MYILLEDAKRHLNIDQSFKEDDKYIINLIQVAEDAVAKRLDRNLEEMIDPKTGYLPKSVIQAILLLIGNFYSARESFTYSSVSEMPQSFEWLANLNKHYWIP